VEQRTLNCCNRFEAPGFPGIFGGGKQHYIVPCDVLGTDHLVSIEQLDLEMSGMA